jgi:hypothetical protein
VRNSYLILAALMLTGGTTIQDAGATTEQINARYVQEHTERIAGHENEPSSRVFKNIRLNWFKDVPAGQLVDIMNGGYSRALGVRCPIVTILRILPATRSGPSAPRVRWRRCTGTSTRRSPPCGTWNRHGTIVSSTAPRVTADRSTRTNSRIRSAHSKQFQLTRALRAVEHRSPLELW